MMSKITAALLSFWMIALSLPVMAQQQPAVTAQRADVETASPQAQAAQQLEDARKNVARLTDLVERAKADDNRLAELKVEVDAAAKQIIAISVATRPRLDEIKAREKKKKGG